MPRRIVEIAPQALADIQADADYIRDELCNPTAAQRMAREIMDRIKSLRSGAVPGTPIRTASLLLSQYRSVLAANHFIFFRIEQNHVLVVRIIHQRRDYEQLLEP